MLRIALALPAYLIFDRAALPLERDDTGLQRGGKLVRRKAGHWIGTRGKGWQARNGGGRAKGRRASERKVDEGGGRARARERERERER